MIYNTRNRSSDITEIKKEKRPVLMLIFSTVSQKSPGVIRRWTKHKTKL